MLSDEEKTHIVEKVQFENDIRKKLSQGEKISWKTLLNHKISLLIIGFLLTGVLGTWFQHRQKESEWKARNRYDNINFRLGMMRDCLKEFTYLSSYVSEAEERLERFMELATLPDKDYEEFTQNYVELQNRRFRQNAKLSSLVIYFRDDNLLTSFDVYLKKFTDYFTDLKSIAKIKHCTSNKDACKPTVTDRELLDNYDLVVQSHKMKLNSSYLLVSLKMKYHIRRIEDERQKWL